MPIEGEETLSSLNDLGQREKAKGRVLNGRNNPSATEPTFVAANLKPC